MTSPSVVTRSRKAATWLAMVCASACCSEETRAYRAVWIGGITEYSFLHKVGRVPASCGYCFGTSPNPSERGQSAGEHHSQPVFKTPSMSLGLHLSTLSPSTIRSSTHADF